MPMTRKLWVDSVVSALQHLGVEFASDDATITTTSSDLVFTEDCLITSRGERFGLDTPECAICVSQFLTAHA